MLKIGFIGCGKMAQALAGGFVESKFASPSQIVCSDVNQEFLDDINKKYGIETTRDNGVVFDKADIVILAVKPQIFADAVKDCRAKVREGHTIVSIMAGVKIDKIMSCLPAPVVRVMPNTPCLVGQMAAGYAVGKGVSGRAEKFIEQMLNCAGLAIRVDEQQLDAVTGLSGSGPAFVAYLIKHFTDAGATLGLSREDASQLAIKTFIGTAVLLQEKQLSPDKLIEMVSSPNGTTVAGRAILESSDVAEIINKTITRATERSRELSK